jgi:rhamnosyltransferase
VKATVFLPTRNGGSGFLETLRAVQAQRTREPFEVLVVDSSSTDGTPEAARAAGARVLAIPAAEFNHGLTRNRGVAEARGELVALLVQDATPADEHWLQALIDALDAEPRAAGAYSRQLPRPGCNPFLKDRLERWAASRTERSVQALDGAGEWERLAPLERLGRIAFDNVSSCVRRAAALEVPFERRQFGEDVTWARAALMRGWRIVYEPRSTVIHSHDRTWWYEFRRVYLDHQNLNALVGLSLVPGFGAYLRGIGPGIGFYRDIARRSGLRGGRRLFWYLQAVPWAVSQGLAQYLGPRSRRWIEEKPWYRTVDRWLRKGV